jgi:hypothetical protein
VVFEITSADARSPAHADWCPGRCATFKSDPRFQTDHDPNPNIAWQRNFFDHRLRHDESLDEKVAYIRENPVRAGLIAEGEEWPYAMDASDLNSRPEASIARTADD